jgi:hypothetical protein
LINSKGKDVAHKELITKVLENLMKPAEIAVVHTAGHQKGYKREAQGNSMEDEVAKEAALQSKAPIFHLAPVTLPQCFVFKRGNDYQNWGITKLLKETVSYLMVEKCSPNQ